MELSQHENENVLERDETIQQSENNEKIDQVNLQTDYEDESKKAIRSKLYMLAGYGIIALGVLDYCLGTFWGVDITGFRFSPMVYGILGGAIVRFSDSKSYSILFAMLGLAAIGTAFMIGLSRMDDNIKISQVVGQWEERLDSNVVVIWDLKEDKSFVQTFNDTEDSVSFSIKGKYNLSVTENGTLAFVTTYDLNTLSDSDAYDFCKEHNENVEKAQKNDELYGYLDFCVEGDTVRFDGGGWRKLK